MVKKSLRHTNREHIVLFRVDGFKHPDYSDNWEKENEKRPKTVFPEINVAGRRRRRRKRRLM